MLPGKKVGDPHVNCDRHLQSPQGISLSVEQYLAFLKKVPAINEALRERGFVVEDDDDVDDAPAVSTGTRKGRVKEEKANIDATSDEDED